MSNHRRLTRLWKIGEGCRGGCRGPGFGTHLHAQDLTLAHPVRVTIQRPAGVSIRGHGARNLARGAALCEGPAQFVNRAESTTAKISTVEENAIYSDRPRHGRAAHTRPARSLVHQHGELVQVGPSQRPRGPAPRPDPLPHRQARPLRRLRPRCRLRARVLAVRKVPRPRRARQGQGHRPPRRRDGRQERG